MNHEIRLNLFSGPFKLISYKMSFQPLHANLQSPRIYEYCLSPGFVIHYFFSLHYRCAVELDCSFDPVLFFILKFIYTIVFTINLNIFFALNYNCFTIKFQFFYFDYNYSFPFELSIILSQQPIIFWSD